MADHVYVVAWGARRPSAGGLIVEADRAAQARRSGAVLLPVDHDLVPDRPGRALDGWSKREHGTYGLELPHPAPARVSPIALWVEPDRQYVSWAIELRLDELDGVVAQGTLRVGPDPTLAGMLDAAAEIHGPPIDVSRLNWDVRIEEGGSFAVVEGALRHGSSTAGLLGLSVYGAAAGCRLRRLAVSLCSAEPSRE